MTDNTIRTPARPADRSALKGRRSFALSPIFWLSAAGGAALTAVVARRRRVAKAVPAELRSPFLLASLTFSPALVAVIRQAMARAPVADMPPGVKMSEHIVATIDDSPGVRIVVFERDRVPTDIRPALLWMHGGGYVIGRPEQDLALVGRILERLDIAIVSVGYRLAPQHPFPAPLEDCHDALRWLVDHAADLAIDPCRIAIGGQSAGGGLAAALVQRAVDFGPIVPAFQLLIYPMLDARTTAWAPEGDVGRFVWTPKSNRFGWASYLGQDPTTGDYPSYAVPADRADLAGLPATWIGVGTLDLFHDEDVAYADHLRATGVECDLHVVAGGYHGFDLLRPQSDITAQFYDSMLAALARGLELA